MEIQDPQWSETITRVLFKKRMIYPGAGGGGTLEGSLGAGVPLSPSNPEHVEDKMILSFRFPVFVTQSPRLFSLSSRNALPDFGEDVNTIEAS